MLFIKSILPYYDIANKDNVEINQRIRSPMNVLYDELSIILIES